MAREDTRARIESLCRAAAGGDADQVAAILDEGMHDASGGNYWQSDGDTRGWRRSPLHLAALEGHIAVVELLLARGAAVNATSKYGDTPLHFAITHGHVEVVTALYKAGADVTVENDEGDTATSLGAKIGMNFG